MDMNPVHDVMTLRPRESADDLYDWFQWTGFLGFWAGLAILCLWAGAFLLFLRRTAFPGFALLMLGWLIWLWNGVLGIAAVLCCPPTHTPETEIAAQALAAFPAQAPLVLPFLAAVLAAPTGRRLAREHPRAAWPAVLATLGVAVLVFPLGLFASRDLNPVTYVWGCWF
jgi:hypothetical protein